MTEERKYDVILWGATGFTGQLVAAYFTRQYGVDGSQLRWAMAGRNQDKLAKVRDELKKIHADAEQVPLLQGDSDDLESLKALAAQTRVICTTVGPYAKYGEKLVAACVEKGAHYCDLTGEPQFIRRMIDTHHEQAQANKVRITNCCGYDSIPSDLGALIVQEEMHKRFNTYCEEVKMYAGPSSGTFSGGTVASMLHLLEEAKKDPSIRRVLGNPYGLNPKDATSGPDGSDQMSVRWDADLKRWTAPFIMASINTRIVRRSNALLDFKYGKDFRYSEVMSLPKGLGGWFMGQSIALGMGGFMALAAFGPTRKLLQSTVLPAPGQGPSPEAQEKGYFTTYLLGKAGEHRLYGFVRGERDPGYGSTAMMLGESAVCLAKDQAKLPNHYGVLTPSTAMGMPLVERLRAVGFTLEVNDTFRAK
ncbi:MAG: saccharopine dehydrogenase NADP-binding domain-containing protein [Myxococcales bacterium]|nr:saccharopine dehydrogenase NADP-binding domain-containing protein [Myxococcales bacterium]